MSDFKSECECEASTFTVLLDVAVKTHDSISV